MKNSLPNGWQWINLGNPKVAKLIMGQSPPSTSYNTIKAGLPFYQGKKEFGKIHPVPQVYCSKPIRIVEPNDILLSVRAPVGPTNICIETSCIGRGLAGIRANKEYVHYKYLLFYFNKIENELTNKGKGSTFHAITKAELQSLPIPLPPLHEQKLIVKFLEKAFINIDTAIELIKTNIKELEKLNAATINEGIYSHNEIKSKLTQACLFNPPKSEVKGNNFDVSFLPMADLQAHQKHFIPIQEKKINEVYTGYTYFKDGDVLLAKVTPCFENGKSGIARNLKNGIGFGSSEYYVFRPKDGVLADYIYYIISRKEFLLEGAKYMSGAVGLKRVTKEFICNYQIPLPDFDTQKNIVNFIDKTVFKNNELIKSYKTKLEYLKTLKSSLLESAFKGELAKTEELYNIEGVHLGIAAEPTTSYRTPLIRKNKRFTDRQMLFMALAIQGNSKTKAAFAKLGKTKMEKLVHIAEYDLGLQFDRNAKKMGLGPADLEQLDYVQWQASSNGFFSYDESRSYDKYQRGDKFQNFIARANMEFKDQLAGINRIINLFLNLDTDYTQIIATVYSAWNNLLIRHQPITEAAILKEARENWHEKKLEIDLQRFKDAILWLKTNGLLPKGSGKEVK